MRSGPCCWCATLFCSIALAQEPDRTRPPQAGDFDSADATKVAWAGHRAGEAADLALIPALRRTLLQWAKTPGAEAELVRLHLLDALVRLNAKVPGNELAPMAREAGTMLPALVLLMRDPKLNECDLFDLFRSGPPVPAGTTLNEEQMRTLAIGDLLAAQRTPGFAAFVWQQLALHVQVVPPANPFPRTAGYAARLWHTRRPLDGFPPEPVYQLGAHRPAGPVARNQLLVQGSTFEVVPPDLTGRSSALVRVVRNAGPGNQPETIDGNNGIRWIEKMAPVQLAQLGNLRCSWTTPQAFLEEVQAARIKLRDRKVEALRALVATGAMTPREAAAASIEVAVHVVDFRTDRSKPLPDLSAAK